MQDELDEQYLMQLRSEREALQKEKVRLQDQRREYNKLLVHDARMEHLYSELEAAAKNMPPIFLSEYKTEPNECEAVVFLADIHFGMTTDNMWNRYDVEICKQRLSKYAAKARKFLQIHRPQKLNLVILGDLIAGCNHTTIRTASVETTVSQLMQASELVAQFISSLTGDAPYTDVYLTYGNHARTQQNKKESEHKDNLEKMVPFWLKERFANCDNVSIVDNEIDGLILLDVLGWGFVCTHGDLEKFGSYGLTMQAVLSKKHGRDINYAVIGDRHHTESKDMVGVESIICPALCGVDDYADDRRLYSIPAQLMMVVTPDGGAEYRSIVRFD